MTTNNEEVKEINIESAQPLTNALLDDSPPGKLPKQSSTVGAITSPFDVGSDELLDIIGDRSTQGVIVRAEAAGGVKLLAEKLHTDLIQGLSAHDNYATRSQVFGQNILPKGKERNLLRILLEAASDKLLIILTVLALVSIVLQVAFSQPEERHLAWLEGAAILAAVVIVIAVGSGNDWSKERQFRQLNKKLERSEPSTVIRAGESKEIPQIEVLVGDVVSLKSGDRIPADGLLIRGNELRADQSSLTGETYQIGKTKEKDILLYGGTEIREGTGTMLVIAVGINTENGRIVNLLTGGTAKKKKKEQKEDINGKDGGNIEMEGGGSSFKNSLNLKQKWQERKERKRQEEEEGERFQAPSSTEGTILQKKLTVIAARIGYFGLIIGILTSLALLIRHFADVKSFEANRDLERIVQIISTGIVVLVVALPEGLPLAVAISLSFSVQRMLKDHNLVRKFYSCETMGNATTICSDKTGTLTTNRMTVVRSFFNLKEQCGTPKLLSLTKELIVQVACLCSNYDSKIVPHVEEIDDTTPGLFTRFKSLIKKCKIRTKHRGQADFTQAKLEEKEALPDQQGNKTECALLQMVLDMETNYDEERQKCCVEDRVKTLEFSSVRKSMTVVINHVNENGDKFYRVLTKGASEKVLDMCKFILDENDNVVNLTPEIRKVMTENISKFASLTLRTICLAYKDIPVPDETAAQALHLSPWDTDNFPEEMTCIGIVGIKDPLRDEVPESIRLCKQAGITVRMVTGDNVDTARAIALDCGIITPNDDENCVFDSKEFNKRIRRSSNGKVNLVKLDLVWPNLRVLARSSPTDKYVLVEGIILSKAHKGQVVAVTGDGTNDGPALQRADVGFAMVRLLLIEC
ncbi:Plasma membrane calcium-transporting ATPase 2 isoform X3 [Oopsacas minuta]|uniref:Plasma membrane calcium-transporting ATPase 2 isoform X3 n=1 Tax=Oopsacas minuta TaxID=111878 RepID=A0AAV7JYS5_9METZ|nr:Plasma membrane calcium-transporting ATPase 2 isoform X3 [Oopsacas minuta]